MGCSSGDGTGYNNVGEIPCLISGAGFKERPKKITNLVNSILQLGNKLVSASWRDISKMSTNQIHANSIRYKRKWACSCSYERVLTEGKHILGYHRLY